MHGRLFAGIAISLKMTLEALRILPLPWLQVLRLRIPLLLLLLLLASALLVPLVLLFSFGASVFFGAAAGTSAPVHSCLWVPQPPYLRGVNIADSNTFGRMRRELASMDLFGDMFVIDTAETPQFIDFRLLPMQHLVRRLAFKSARKTQDLKIYGCVDCFIPHGAVQARINNHSPCLCCDCSDHAFANVILHEIWRLIYRLPWCPGGILNRGVNN
jgi:hypothetical protein